MGVLGIHSHLCATIIDLPSVTPITQSFVGKSEVAERIQVKSVDLLSDGFDETYDVATLRAFIQVLGPEDARQAILNVGKTLRPGGNIYIIGSVLDDSRISPALTVAFNLLFLNVYDEGQAYTEQEYRSWLHAAGIHKITRKLLIGWQ